MNRLNYYLLTHHPLLWNTRVVWVLLANFIIHLLFFLSGLGAVSTKTLSQYHRYESIGGTGMYTMSVLCALVVLIVWCIYYLRNNAFKSFYRIGKWYLAKEFGIIFLIILTSICYSLSFNYGVGVRIRTITSKEEFVKEVEVTNKAMVYVPLNKDNYFILNSCYEKRRRDSSALPSTVTESSSLNYVDSATLQQALQQPDAYSYKHYCSLFLSNSPLALSSEEAISETNRNWLSNNKRDSVQQVIASLFTILDKYDISHNLKQDDLFNAVFSNPYHHIHPIISSQEYSYEYGGQRSPYFLYTGSLDNALEIIDESYSHDVDDTIITWNIVGYISLSFSVLLLCYRRFSRRVFLISVVGTLVWTILVGLMTLSSGSSVGFAILLLVLFCIFLATALVLLKSRDSKTTAGVLLNWQAYISPFVIMLIVALIEEYRDKHYYAYSAYANTDALMQQHYPFSTWVKNHTGEIFLVNILLVGFYTAFVFNQWAKKWQTLPEE